MKGKQWLAWMLVLTLAVSLAFSALAAPAVETTPAEGEETAEPAAPAGPDDGGAREPDAIDQPVAEAARKAAEKLEKLIGEVTKEPQVLKSVAFEDVEKTMRENNLQILGLQGMIDYLGTVNYTQMSNSLRDQLNMLAEQQFAMMQVSGSPLVPPGAAAQSAYAATQLEQLYGTARSAFDDIKEGKLQTENAGRVRQMRYSQDLLVMVGESTHIALRGVETQRAALARRLAALDRTLEELELRNRLGQVSDLQLREARSGREQLESTIATVDMNIKTAKYQLENLLGVGLTGSIALGSIPAVTEKQIAAMDEEKDLASAKAASYEIYAAGKTLEEAKATYDGQVKGTGYSTGSSTYRLARSNWTMAQNTYNAALQSFELKFRTLYSQVKDYYQVWEHAEAALEDQRVSYEAAETKQRQGNLSWNALLSARDEVSAAEDAVAKARNDLFASYNTYCWAVEHGILN